MDTLETPSQPSQEADAVNAALGLESSQAVAPTDPDPAPVEESPFDPATIRIPNRKFVDNVPKSLEKFKDKTLTEVGNLIEETERWGHSKAQEAAQARRETEDYKTRLAVAEQLARMLPKEPERPAPDLWQREGINPNEAIFTEPGRVLETHLSEAERRAAAAGEAGARKVQAEMQSQQRREQENAAIINAFETAKDKVRKLGYEISDEQWRQDLQYIGPAVARENQSQDGLIFQADRYVEHFVSLRGAPRAQLPSEGNPPISARSSAAPPSSVATVNREETSLRRKIGNALGMAGDDLETYIKRGGETR